MMSEATHSYSRPDTVNTRALPKEITAYLDGNDLLAKTQALRISTIDPKGWPHASLLSAGDMVALPPERIRFVMFPQSRTAANLIRDGRMAITLSHDGGMLELLMNCRRLAYT